MPWFTKPKGSLMRLWPEWDSDHMAICGMNVNGDANHSWGFLWNDSNPPCNFYVYAFAIGSANQNDLWQGTIVSGTSGNLQGLAYTGTKQQTAKSISALGAAPPGSTYTVGGQSPTLANNCQVLLAQSLQLDPIIMCASWPLMVIPPNSGWAWCQSGGGGINCFFTWWYLYK